MQRLFLLLALVCLASGCSVPDFEFRSPTAEALDACRDGKLSGGESDVDCGGNCPSACASGAACSVSNDCTSSFCSNSVCTDQTCSDALRNQDETDIDCGGDTGCVRCAPGLGCISNGDCNKGICLSGVCTGQTCNDGIKNQSESDVDCGGTTGCIGCDPGKACNSSDDCNLGACVDGMCRAPSCDDGIENQSESDVDCGGACSPCANGKSCKSASDCDLALCTGGKCRSQSCLDGLINQDESDVDCGGLSGCARCTTGQQCLSVGDCDNASCAKGSCQPASCTDSLKNGSETDVDCGSSCSKPCANGKGCVHGNDCTSQVCLATTHICQVPTCKDGIKNGTEPTVDCGATCANKCVLADTCVGPNDCASGKCTDTHCVPPAATGTPIATTNWLATASSSCCGTTPQRVFDGDLTTDWNNGFGQVPGMWFQWDMLKPQVFFAVTVSCVSTTTDYGRTLRLSSSLDGKTFTELRSVPGENVLKITFNTPQYARYLKLETLASTNGLFWRIDEISVTQ